MMKKLFTFCFIAVTFKCFSQAVTPISCGNAQAYVVMQDIPGTSGISGFYSVDIGTGHVSLIKNPIIPTSTGITGRRINCIGHNKQDGFIYGYRTNSNQIIKIDANGNYDLITVPGLSSSLVGSATAGAVHENTLYIFKNSTATLYKIDLSTLAVSTTNFSTPIPIFNFQINDFTFGSDHNIYGITQPAGTSTRKLFRINLTTNALQFLGDALGADINSEQDTSWGTTFRDVQNNLYVGNNGSRNTYKFTYNSATQTYDLNASLFNTADNIGQVLADGASCNFTLPPNTHADQYCIAQPTLPQTITFSVLANDVAGTYAIDPQTVKLIDPVTSTPSTSVTISGQGTFTVNAANGEITFSSLSTFTQPVTIEYIVADTLGNISSPAIITIGTCYCTNPAATGAPDGYTKFGITVQKKQDAWPTSIPNGFIALESKEKGFVISRVSHVSATPQTGDSITEPKEGMIVYDIQDACVKLFNGTQWKCINRSCN